MPVKALDTVTFTVKKVPNRLATKKTIERLMGLDPEVSKIMKSLQRRRATKDNVMTTRAGRPWVNRKRATRVKRCTPGTSFTLFVTPHLLPDIEHCAAYLETK